MFKFEKIFSKIYHDPKRWKTAEGCSGPGSTLEATKSFREGLSNIIQKYEIKSIIDCACGDWNWMKEMKNELPDYLGVDIVPELIQSHQDKYQTEKIKFIHYDIFRVNELRDQVDLIIARHVLEHHKTEKVLEFLKTIKGFAKYALITSNNIEKTTRELKEIGRSRGINLEIAPFSLGEPLERILDVADISSWDGIHGVFGYLYKFN